MGPSFPSHCFSPEHYAHVEGNTYLFAIPVQSMGSIAHTPSGFFVESGWGGRIIDRKTWVPHEIMLGPSFWGHERLYLPENERSAFRDKRLKIAKDGQRAPLLVDRPWLFQKRD